MERPPRRWLRFFVIVALGGIGIGVCLAALVPGIVKIAGSSQYSGKVGPLLSRQCAICGEPTTVYDANGKYLDTLGLRDRRPVQLSDVPKSLISSVIATEDRTFYTNPGVDVQSMIRAFLENIDKGGVEQGGSTITQQLIKNRVLKHPKQDLNRKIKEAALAIRLNEEWSKNHILEEYLNTVYFGQGSYGVKAAAARYFDNTPLDKIDLAQAALLAGLIKNPEGDNPFLHPSNAFIRRAQVLSTMQKQHRITKAQQALANAQPLPTVPPPAEFRPDNYYVATVRDLLTTDPKFGLGATDKEREDKLNLGGLRVFTAYDPTSEFLAQSSIDNTVPLTQFKLALAAMDPSNGDVKAIVAGPHLSFNDSPYNLATMPLDTGREPGADRSPARIDVQGGRARHRARERVLGQGLGGRDVAVHPAAHRQEVQPAAPDPERRGRRWRHEPPERHRELGELRVLPPRRRSGPPEDHRHGEAARDHPPDQPGQLLPLDRLLGRRLPARHGDGLLDLRRRRRPPRSGVHHQGRGLERPRHLPGQGGGRACAGPGDRPDA